MVWFSLGLVTDMHKFFMTLAGCPSSLLSHNKFSAALLRSNDSSKTLLNKFIVSSFLHKRFQHGMPLSFNYPLLVDHCLSLSLSLNLYYPVQTIGSSLYWLEHHSLVVCTTFGCKEHVFPQTSC